MTVIVDESRLTKSKYYSHQEIVSSQKRYIPIYFQKELPDYTKARQVDKFQHFKFKKNKNFEGVEYFSKVIRDYNSENSHYFILGSAGIGKTTFLLNLYSYCVANFSNLNIEIFPLRAGNFENDIKELGTSKQNTVLLLDGFDELPNFNNDSLKNILDLTKGYRAVIISSRLESFKNVNSDLNNTSFVKYSGDKDFFSIKKLYITPFSKRDVSLYLKHAFVVADNEKFLKLVFLFFGNPNISDAKQLINRVRFASLRPLFLYYITDLVKGEYDVYNYDFEIYEELVNKWINRESFDVEEKEVFYGFFQNILIKIAGQIYNSDNGYIEYEDLKSITSEYSGRMQSISSKSKSLLVRNKLNQYYFFHNSILDYLLAKETFNNIKDNIPLNFVKFRHLSLRNHLLYEMLVSYLFNKSDKVSGSSSESDKYIITSPLNEIRSLNDILRVKYLNISDAKIPYSFLSLFPNVTHLKAEFIGPENLINILDFKKLKKLDLTSNRVIVDLSCLSVIDSLEELTITNSNVDLSTLKPKKNISRITLDKNKYSSELLNRFPKGVLKSPLMKSY